MNILIVCETQEHGFGAERVLEYLLAGWVDRGLQTQNPIRILAPEKSTIHQYASDLHIETQVFRHVTGKLHKNIIGPYLGSHTYASWIAWADIIHAWSARAFELAWLLKRKQPDTLLSGTLHDHPHAAFHGYGRRKLMEYVAGKMDALACVSHAVLEAVTLAGYHCRTTVCHNGMPPTNIHPRSKNQNKPLQIGFLGMYADRKGFDLVSEWIKAIENLKVVWNLYGEPTPRNQTLLKTMPRNIQLMGWVPMRDIWPNIDILIQASTEFDPFPTVLLEAAAAGIPSVSSNLGGAPEIIKHEETGYLFDSGNPLEGMAFLNELLQNSTKLHQLGNAARKQYETSFTSNHMAETYLGFWQDL